MADWKDNKGIGPWDFIEQPDKWGYLNNPRWTDKPEAPVNYTSRENMEPQVWDSGNQNSPTPVNNEFSKDHKPCGHWHKIPIEGSWSGIPEFEIYFELLPGSVAQPYIYPHTDLLASESFIPINIGNFDGDLIWQFEVIGFNSNSFDVTIQVVDPDNNVYSSIILPSGTIGPTGYELYRFRSDFTPSIYVIPIHYGIKVIIPEGEVLTTWPLKCMISVARIIVRQSNATKTSMQIPLYGSSYNYILQESAGSYPYDYPIGWALGGPYFVDIESGISDAYKNVSLWKYNVAELSNISKLTFSPAAKGAQNKIVSGKWQKIYATFDFQHFHHMLYSTTAHDTLRADATPMMWTDETQVHTDNVSGLVYTPIPGSYIFWDGAPYPFTYNLTPNFSGLGPGTHYIAIGGELYFGLPPENQWKHWGEFFHFTIPPGYHMESVTLTVTSELANRMKWELSYSMMPDGDTNLTLSLYDATAGAIVPGSELVWAWDEEFSRKFVELPSSSLINDHEYRLGIDSPVDYIPGSATQNVPEIMDAQLLLNIDRIEHLTTWRRCLMQFIGNWDNWIVPLAWGGNYWGTSEGSINISPRMLMFFSGESEIYFEVSIFSDESWWAGQEGYACAYLEDLGIDGSSGSTGSDVDGSLLEWPEDIENKISRKRTGMLALINDNEYGNRQPTSDVEYVYFPNGFIVTRIVWPFEGFVPPEGYTPPEEFDPLEGYVPPEIHPPPPPDDIPDDGVILLQSGFADYIDVGPGETVFFKFVAGVADSDHPIQVSNTPQSQEPRTVYMLIKRGSKPTIGDFTRTYQMSQSQSGTGDLYWQYSTGTEFVEIVEPMALNTFYIMLYNNGTRGVRNQRLILYYYD